jgi:4-amino-4-deoxy-L-arabinose transferase-like glycosyltransferase
MRLHLHYDPLAMGDGSARVLCDGRIAVPRRRGEIQAWKRRAAAACLALIVVSLLARVGWSAWIAHAHPGAVRSNDTQSYVEPAKALAHDGHLTLRPNDPTPIFVRTPGYPAFAAAILWVTDSVWSISPIQAALSVLSVVLTFVVARQVVGATGALVAAAIAALDPLQFASSGTLLTESLATLIMIAMVWAATRVFARDATRLRPGEVAVFGLLIAFATMVRPTTYYLPLFVLVLFLAPVWRLSPRRRVVLVAAFLGPIVVVVGGWQVRNHHEVDSWRMSGIEAINLYCYRGASVDARVWGRGVHETRVEFGCTASGEFNPSINCPSWWACNRKHPLAYGRGFDEMASRGLHLLVRHPVDTAYITTRGIGREVLGPGTAKVARFLNVRPSFVLKSMLSAWNVALWIAAFVGALLALRARRRMFWLFVDLVIVYTIVVSAGPEADARFRTPLVPLLALLAAFGTQRLTDARCVRAASITPT